MNGHMRIIMYIVFYKMAQIYNIYSTERSQWQPMRNDNMHFVKWATKLLLGERIEKAT